MVLWGLRCRVVQFSTNLSLMVAVLLFKIETAAEDIASLDGFEGALKELLSLFRRIQERRDRIV